jgi:tetratricopeptide (TPR) repeat protein
LVGLLAAEAEAEGDNPHGHELRHKLGQLQLEKLGDPIEAVRAFVSAGDWNRACEVARDGRFEREQGRRVCRELFELAVAAFHTDHDDPSSPAAVPARWALEELAARLRAAAMMTELVALLLEGSRLMFPSVYRRKLLRDAACLCSDQLADTARAMTIFEALFVEDQSDEHAAFCVGRFARLLEEANRIEEVIGLWEAQATVRLASNERMAAAALWVRAAQLAEERLGDIERALRDYAEGAELGLDTALSAQARLYGERGQHERAAAALVRLCSQSNRETLGERSLWLASEYLKAHRPDLARNCLEDASSRALEVGLVRQRLGLLYEELELWRPLAELSALEATERVDNHKRLELFERAALIFVSRLGDSAAAIPMLEQALELDQESLNLRIRLAEALMAAGAPERAAQVLREQLERYGARRPKDRASVHYTLARALVELGEGSTALEELILASRIDPAHSGILKLTSQLALEQGDLVRAERSLRALLVLSRRDDPDSPLRSEALLALSDIASSSGDSERAKEAIESAFEAAVESEREAVALEGALRERNRNDLLIRALTQHLEHAQQPADAANALLSLVQLLRNQGEELGSREPVLRRRAEAIESALGSSNTDPNAVFGALEQFYSCLADRGATRRIQQLQVLGWLDPARPVMDASLLFELAEQQVIPRESRSQALRLLQRAAEVQPDYPRALAILSPVLTEDPDWSEGLDLLLDVARRAGRKDWLVSILEQRVNGSARTLGQLEEMLTLARELGDKPALMRLLARAIVEPINTVLSPSARASLTLELAELVERTGDIGSTLELREQAAAGLSVEQARPILLEVARCAVEKLGDATRAATIYERLHQNAPAERSFWEPLLGLLRQLGHVEAEMLVIERALAATTAPSLLAILNLEQARILVSAGNDASAAAILRNMLHDDPDCTDAALLLAEIFERGGRGAELILLLSRQLELSCQQGNPASILAVGLRVASLYESMRRWDEGLSTLERVLAVVPNHRPALEATARIAEQVGDLGRAAAALGRLLPLLPPEDQLTCLYRLLAIWEQLGDEVALDATLRRGVELLPGRRELVERLVQRLVARGDQAGVVEVLEGAVRVNPGELELSLQLAGYLRTVGRLSEALAIVESFLSSAEPTAALFRERGLVLLMLGRLEEALAELERGDLTTTEGAEALLLGLRARSRVDSEEIYLSLGLREVEVLSSLSRYDEARAVLDELDHRFVDDLRVLRARARLASTCLDWQGVVDAYAVVAEVADGPELVGLVIELARASEQLGVPERARSALERALTVEPSNEELRSRLGAVYQAVGATRELSGLLLDGARRIPEPAARQARLLEIAEMLLGSDSDLSRVQVVLEEARTLGPENLETIVLLARLETKLGHGDEALNLLTEAVTAQRGRRSRGLARIYREMSQIQLLDGFLSDALDSLVKASEMDIRNGSLGMELATLALEIDEKDIALRSFGRVALMKLAEGDSPEGVSRTERAAANYQLALHAKVQGDQRKTKMLLQKVLADDASHSEASALLEEIG